MANPNENVQLADQAIEKISDKAIEHLPENLQDNFTPPPPPVVLHASMDLSVNIFGKATGGFDLETGTTFHTAPLEPGPYPVEVDFSISVDTGVTGAKPVIIGQDLSVGTAYDLQDFDSFVYDPAAPTSDFALNDAYAVVPGDSTFVFTESDGDTYVVGNFVYNTFTATLEFDYYLVS
jgi:hypothetical protein